MNEHINRQYDQELEALRSRILEMGGLVESQVRMAVAGYLAGEAQRAGEVIALDARVNQLEIAIDHDLGQLIVRRQPAASDLRLIMAAGKIVTDLERIGDEATKIARMAREIAAHAAPSPLRLPTLGNASEIAVGMLRAALDAFARLDAASAANVIAEDSRIDEDFHATVRQLVTFMMEDPRTISAALNAVWAARAFERIGDHAKNVAESVIYVVRGRDVRHIPLADVQREALGR